MTFFWCLFNFAYNTRFSKNNFPILSNQKCGGNIRGIIYSSGIITSVKMFAKKKKKSLGKGTNHLHIYPHSSTFVHSKKYWAVSSFSPLRGCHFLISAIFYDLHLGLTSWSTIQNCSILKYSWIFNIVKPLPRKICQIQLWFWCVCPLCNFNTSINFSISLKFSTDEVPVGSSAKLLPLYVILVFWVLTV